MEKDKLKFWYERERRKIIRKKINDLIEEMDSCWITGSSWKGRTIEELEEEIKKLEELEGRR